MDNDHELEAAIPGLGFQYGNSVAVEEFVEGHEGFYDTISIGGRVVLEFASHYYPNVLEAMRTRWISRNGESSSTNAFPFLSMRKTRPGDSVPAIRSPPGVKASDTTFVTLAL